jgi:hypothetical protein
MIASIIGWLRCRLYQLLAPRGANMRGVYVLVALLAILAGARGIKANVAGTDRAGISTFDMPVAGADDLYVRSEPETRGNLTRLAQAATLTWQQTTGSPSVAPFKWAGLLKNATTTKNAPHGWSCTAQFIKPNVLLTAAHCLIDISGGLPVNSIDPAKITFLLQYQDGLASQTFKAVCGAVNPQWTLPSDYSSMSALDQSGAQNVAGEHDFAMVLVDGTSSTGAMEYELDWKGKYTSAARVGYPGDILNADIIQYAPGIVFFADAIPLPKGLNLPANVVQWGPVTDATHGMSGGAWVANMSSTEAPNKNILIAVTSSAPQLHNSAIPMFPGGTWAAYLTAAEFNPLLDFVSNGCK